MGNTAHKSTIEDIEFDPPRVVSLIHENESSYGTYQPMVDHFQKAADRRKLRKMFGILENMPGSEKLFGIKEMFYTKQLNAWLLYFKKMSEIPYLHRKDQKLIKKLIEKLTVLSVDFPVENLNSMENREEIQSIEAEFLAKHGFIAQEPEEVPEKFDFSEIFTESGKSGKWSHPKLLATYHFRSDNEERMFEIIEKNETEMKEKIEKMTESSEMEEDVELEDMWNRRIRNKILQVKYFSIYPH